VQAEEETFYLSSPSTTSVSRSSMRLGGHQAHCEEVPGVLRGRWGNNLGCLRKARPLIIGDVQARKRALALFSSLDRYVSQRPLQFDKTQAYHTTTPPALLSGRERDDRQRDYTVDPFRSQSVKVNFLGRPSHDDKLAAHERHLALALDIDQANRILVHQIPPLNCVDKKLIRSFVAWNYGAWSQAVAASRLRRCLFMTSIAPLTNRTAAPKKIESTHTEKVVPTVPFRVLDAPNLKDDYYCSILAYCSTCHTLAVALGHKVYLWTEKDGVRYPPLLPVRSSNFVTSLAFSSEAGGKAILAVARSSGSVVLWSLLESRPRFDAPHAFAASCVSFKPVPTRRLDVRAAGMTSCEDLLVGDDSGKVYCEYAGHIAFDPASACHQSP
jgi:hypothetical protein